MSVKVKICGLTNKDDAIWAINYGADFLGFNFWKGSPRHVTLATFKKFRSELPPFAAPVGVFVDATEDEIVKTVNAGELKGVQLHGNETPEFVARLKEFLAADGKSPFLIKAVRVQDESSLASLGAFASLVDYFLLDACVPGEVGGTGVTFNWDLAVKAKDGGKPLFLAGGLTPGNVRDAVKKVQPYGVDVASGVEKSPKRKDPAKVKEFIGNAKK